MQDEPVEGRLVVSEACSNAGWGNVGCYSDPAVMPELEMDSSLWASAVGAVAVAVAVAEEEEEALVLGWVVDNALGTHTVEVGSQCLRSQHWKAVEGSSSRRGSNLALTLSDK